MTTNNTFKLSRFGLLCRQNFIHHLKLLLTAVVGFCGALFLVLLTLQFMDGFEPVDDSKSFFGVFVFVSCATAIIYAGTAFPAFRSKEKSVSYLMNPASVFEKFVFEFVIRIMVFIIVVPLLYWGVYNLEGYLVTLFYPPFDFEGQFSGFTSHTGFDHEPFSGLRYTSLVSVSMLFLVIPFTGAAIFDKNPLIKTIFALAVILFFNTTVVYFFIEVLQWEQYHAPSDSILFFKGPFSLFAGISGGGILLNGAFITAAYYKLKEKEV